MSLSNQQNQGGSIGNPGLPKTQKTTKRVADIILDKNHIAYNGPDSIGIIFFTDEKTKESANDTTTLPRAKPLNLNNFTTPLIGELVNVIQSTSDDYYSGLGGNSNFTSNYYTPAINIHNNAGSNAVPLDTKAKKKNKTSQSSPNFEFQKEFRTRGSQDVAVKMLNNYLRTLGLGGRSDPKSPVYILSQDNNNGEFILRLDDSKDNKVKLGTYYKENPNQKNLNLTEGGTVNQGKSGQRISFSANDKANQGPGSGLGGIEQNRAMVLSLGDGEVEDINDDDGTIHLATNRKVNIKTSSNLIASLRSEYKPYVEPLKEIEKEPVIDIPTTNPTPTLQVENHFAGIGAKVKETTTTTVAEVDVEDPFYDPVFAALDEAQDAGLLTFNSFDSISISGTPDSDEVNETEGEISGPPPPSDSTPPPLDYPPINLDEFPAGLNFKEYKALYKDKYDAPYALRNRNKIKAWKSGQTIFMETCSGRRFPIPPPDPNLNISLSSRNIKYIIIHCTAGALSSNPASTLQFFFSPDDPTKEGSYGRLFERPGYHWMIESNGNATHCLDDNERSQGISANSGVTNTNSINLNWIGGYGKINITDQQTLTLKKLIKKYIDLYPNAKLIGHNQIAANAKALGYSSLNYSEMMATSGTKRKNNWFKEKPDDLSIYSLTGTELANKVK